MLNPINIFLPAELSHSKSLENVLNNNTLINKVFLIQCCKEGSSSVTENIISIESYLSSDTFNFINLVNEDHDFIFITDQVQLDIPSDSLLRLIKTAQDTSAGIVTSSHYENFGDEKEFREVLNYHTGSVRDDFYFGPLLYFNHKAFDFAVTLNKHNLKFAGLYDIRLSISEKYLILNIPETLYSFSKISKSKNLNEKHFFYVDPKNRDAQIEMEKVFTDHLGRINALVKKTVKKINPDDHSFAVQASVIIPVKNRVKTISDAVQSALNQKTNFVFNIIVIDNHSSDGTTDLLREFSGKHDSIKHIIPERNDLAIGGCWNDAVHSEHCGKYSVQLDSDDLYKDENTLQKIVDTFKSERCAMVIGAYLITDFSLNEIPPGIIDHREWTIENGMNNALRINGLGAPRAFYTPVLREINFPNVSYGEDYSVALRISREYKIGRIYEPIYLCRRWEGNSDHNISHFQQNKNNSYKDFLRLYEIITRQKMNNNVE